ncbi:OmpA family protein [Actinomyces weissii]|uniref:OmpA family protein n=1 Tax=Actinomyces weissii TaxID=675090 RepID=A0A7T7MA90_9ACTO|nr:OmpA family protein [Actinomyces weissii]QQM67703.1 OmpA family protein [Actinomyces weissii]
MVLVSRRATILASLAAAGIPVLAACSKDAQGVADGAATATPSAAAVPANADGVSVRTSLGGQVWDVHVGPAVVRDGLTVLRVAYSPSAGEKVTLGAGLLQDGSSLPLGGLRLLSLPRSVMYPVIGGYQPSRFSSASVGEWIQVFPVYNALPEGLDSVEVMVPRSGVVLGVPVVAPSQAGFDLDEVLREAKVDRSAEGSYRIITRRLVADGSADTKEDEGVTTVTISGDVTFDPGSATLSAQADAVLASVVEQVGRFPSGGTMEVTGHTDDVLDDASNQILSEQRAQAVAQRLGQLTSLSAWTQTVSGKGETAPRVPNDSEENRQLNRRVEVLLTPVKPEEGQQGRTGQPTAPPTGPGQQPAARGPVGTGKDGVDVQYEGSTIHVWMDKVTRVNGFLVGEVLMRSATDVELPYGSLVLPSSFSSTIKWGDRFSRVCSLTLLKGNVYLPVAAYLVGGEETYPLSGAVPVRIKGGGEPVRLPAVWPDTGEDKVVLDLPGLKQADTSDAVLALRLTDIPVEQA